MSILLLASVPDEKKTRLSSYLVGATFVLIFLMPFSSLYSICFSSRGSAKSCRSLWSRGFIFLKKQLLVYTVLGVLGGAVLYLLCPWASRGFWGKVYPFDRTAPGHGFRAAGGGDE